MLTALLCLLVLVVPATDAFSVASPAIISQRLQHPLATFPLYSSSSSDDTASTGDGDDDAGVSDNNTGDDSVRVSTGTGLKGVNGQLLAALATLDQPVVFDATADAHFQITKLAASLEGTYILPLDKPSEWTLVYSTAPDLLGLAGGPLSELVGITQSLTQTEWTYTLKYRPSSGMQSLVRNLWPDVADDRLTQTVVFDYDMPTNGRADLKLRNTKIEATRLPFEAPAVPILGGPVLPAVGLKIVFNDGELRMDRTVQGDFLFVYRRLQWIDSG